MFHLHEEETIRNGSLPAMAISRCKNSTSLYMYMRCNRDISILWSIKTTNNKTLRAKSDTKLFVSHF
jgi:hypothetical protein